MSREQGNEAGSPRKIPITPEQLAAAITSEADLAERAAKARTSAERASAKRHDGEVVLDRQVVQKLAPYMREKIPDGFISEVSAGKGKPYPSKGVSSLQVQIDRMDAVWGLTWWGWRTEWIDGNLAEVTVWIGESEDRALVKRSARGGMNGGSTVGNHFKGTETNAGKMAFARIGPGHEVYIGATDFDPDTDEEAAEAQAHTVDDRVAAIARAAGEHVAEIATLWETVKKQADNEDKVVRDFKLWLGANMAVSTSSMSKAFAELTPAQVPAVKGWLEGHVKPEPATANSNGSPS